MPKEFEWLPLAEGSPNLFGYDTFLKEGNTFTGLCGKDKPALTIGTRVELQGDSKEYIPGPFKHGRTAVIVGFREAFKDNCSEYEGSPSDDIVSVCDGESIGWVKPFNIKPI